MATGYEMANAPLYRASLAPLSQATRAEAAPRVDPPAHWEDLLRR
jgi:hypothetical protein